MMLATLPTSQDAARLSYPPRALPPVYAGISHMTFRRADFVAQVPDWLTMSKDFVVLASGVVEMLLGLSLVVLYRSACVGRAGCSDLLRGDLPWQHPSVHGRGSAPRARYGCEALGAPLLPATAGPLGSVVHRRAQGTMPAL